MRHPHQYSPTTKTDKALSHNTPSHKTFSHKTVRGSIDPRPWFSHALQNVQPIDSSFFGRHLLDAPFVHFSLLNNGLSKYAFFPCFCLCSHRPPFFQVTQEGLNPWWSPHSTPLSEDFSARKSLKPFLHTISPSLFFFFAGGNLLRSAKAKRKRMEGKKPK